MSARNAAVCAALLLCCTLSATRVSAQVKPPGTQPGQVERQFEKPPEPSAKPGSIAIPTTGQTPPPNAAAIKFVLNQLTIDGTTVYPADKLRSLYAASLHKEVSLVDVYRIVDAITARYRNDGYILSQVIVPAQSVENGVIKLQAIEGYIADVRVEGATPELRERVRKYGEKIRKHRPLTAAALERQVLLMNDLPGVVTRAVLAPSQTPGASDLVLQVSRHRVAGGISSDNRGSIAQGQQRIFADIEFQNLFAASRTELRSVTTGTPELNYAALMHEQVLGTHGGRLGISGSYVYSRPQELSIVPIDLVTKSGTATLTYTHPLIRRRARNLYLHGTFSSFDSSSTVFDVADTTERIRDVRLGFTYDFGDGIGGVNIADVEYSQGLQGLGASTSDDAYLSRPNGRADFQRALLYAARIQGLPGSFSMMIATNAQYAFTDLLAPQLFAFGGELFGRGYDPSQLLNDHGVAAKLDLRYARTWGGQHQTTLMPYGFFDAGRVWQRTPLPGIESSQTATTAGFGVRLQVGMRLSGFVEYAKPLDAPAGLDIDKAGKVYGGISIH
ncbi:MAG TPA: POTRA domain-containing protein [Vicinamibacterales bacterium]